MARYKAGTMKHGIFAGMSFKDLNFIIEYSKDFNARRAAMACGMEPEEGHALRKKPHMIEAIQIILSRRLITSDIDAEWVLMEAVDNVLISRQLGKLSASNAALNIVAKHCKVDAYATTKVSVDVAGDVVERLKRGRRRVKEADTTPSFL